MTSVKWEDTVLRHSSHVDLRSPHCSQGTELFHQEITLIVSSPIPLKPRLLALYCSLIPANHQAFLHRYDSVIWRMLYQQNRTAFDPFDCVFSLSIMPLKLRLCAFDVRDTVLHVLLNWTVFP